MPDPVVPVSSGPYTTGAFPLHPDVAAKEHSVFTPPPGALTSYPSVSWKEWCNPIRDQSSRGYCVGFGSAKAVEVLTALLFGKKSAILSPQDLYARALQYDGLADWRKANGYPEGTYVFAAAKALFQEGVALEADCPFTPAIPVHGPDPATRLTTEHCISGSQVAYGVEAWKAMIQKGPLVCVFMCDAPLFNPKDGVVDYDGSSAFNEAHCLPLVEWDADRGMFLAPGSWGPTYGDQGSVWLTQEWIAERGADGTLFTVDLNRKIGGDLNADTRVNYADVLEALQIVTGRKVVNDFVKHVLDVNGDKADTVQDALFLLRKSVGLA